jgi:hypothetical protein
MKWLWGRMRPGDRVLVPLLLLVAVALIPLQFCRQPGRSVIAEVAGKVVFSAPLDRAQQVELSGPLGKTLLRIADGQARILASPCPNKLCIGMGQVSRSGELLACVPNRVLVRIEGGTSGAEQAYDLLSH